MMKPRINNFFRRDLLNRNLSVGSWIMVGHPVVGEILSNVGFDWIAVDMEHTDIDISAFSNIIRGMKNKNTVPIARVRENDTLAIRQVLDAGAMGVIVPLVNNAEQAKEAVRSAKYPPFGVRGFAFCRANSYGIDFDEYVKQSNDNTIVIVMIESKEAIENIEEIVAVDGVDGVFIGPYDLSGSYGIPGQINNKIIKESCDKVINICKENNMSVGIHLVNPTQENIKETISNGFNFIALGIDTVFINNGAREAFQNLNKMLKSE